MLAQKPGYPLPLAVQGRLPVQDPQPPAAVVARQLEGGGWRDKLRLLFDARPPASSRQAISMCLSRRLLSLSKGRAQEGHDQAAAPPSLALNRVALDAPVARDDNPAALGPERLDPDTILRVGREPFREVDNLITFRFEQRTERAGEIRREIVVENDLQATSRFAARCSNRSAAWIACGAAW
jgi:hypothetical protein